MGGAPLARGHLTYISEPHHYLRALFLSEVRLKNPFSCEILVHFPSPPRYAVGTLSVESLFINLIPSLRVPLFMICGA